MSSLPTPEFLRASVPDDADRSYIVADLRSLAVPISSLLPDPRNARKHPEKNLDAVKASLRSFGQRKPVVVNSRTLIVEAGNGTIEAAKAIGWQYVAAVFQDDDAVTATGYGLADNRSAELAEWDTDVLTDLIKDLKVDGVDVSDLGWSGEDLLAMLPDDSGGEDDGGDDDPAPIDKAAELQKVWQTARGQVWEIPSKSVPGRCHRVTCGDSLDPEVIAKVLDVQVPDGVWSDAPYGIAIVAGSKVGGDKPATMKGATSGKVIRANTYSVVAGDETTDTAIESFRGIWGMFPSALHIWWGANHFSPCLPASSCWIVWDKENTGNFADCELAWCSDKGAVRIFRHMWNGMLKASERGDCRVHPTQKPVALFEWCAQKFLPGAGKVWLDPFAGSGISLLGAERLGQIACCVELSEAYVAVILERAKNAGLEPRLLE